jgi:predicted RNase H-like nuclease (RuvC/YqgF family)
VDEPVRSAPSDLVERLRRQDVELERLRRDLNPARRAEEQRVLERQQAQIRELRGELQARDRRIEQLQRARHDETSPMRMSGHALDAFNQSRDLERMARIARTLGEPVVNVHDEGAGIPRRVRITLSWDIAWYEFTVKLDIGAGRASVHETGTGGEPSVLPLERRRANACWSGSGLKLS